MKTSTLQSILSNFSKQITYIENEINSNKMYVALCKHEGSAKSSYVWCYKEIEESRKKLKNLVGIQKKLKGEIVRNIYMTPWDY